MPTTLTDQQIAEIFARSAGSPLVEAFDATLGILVDRQVESIAAGAVKATDAELRALAGGLESLTDARSRITRAIQAATHQNPHQSGETS